MKRPVLDVAHLPTHAFGARDPIWWGVVCLVAIESTVFALLLATYFYLRANENIWPPSPIHLATQVLAVAEGLVLLASLYPNARMNHCAKDSNVRGMRRWLWILTGFVAVFLVLRIVELSRHSFQWTSHAYGSVFWVTEGMHTMHGSFALLENLAFLTVLHRGPVEEKFAVDVHVNGVYWYFVVAAWIPILLVFYFDPGRSF
jgi:heme/copper-type cytochrome/quinol oxidase subunit 3